MSRCFPYPPPGYARNGIRDEALVESIKLQREGQKAKKEKKKEKKQEKREKGKTRGGGDIESKKHSHKKRRKDERSKEDQKGGELQKRTENETEQIEKSSLTEERGHPVGSQTSSDSTLNSNKRQRLSLPPNGRHNAGSIIRIRLPAQRHRDPEVLPLREQPCLAPGSSDDASVQVMHEPAPIPSREGVENPCSASGKMCPEFAMRLSKKNPCLVPGRIEDASIHLMHEPVPRSGGGVVENPCSTSRKMCPEHSVRLCKEKPRLPTAVSESSKKPRLSTGDSECYSQMAETSVPSKFCGSCSPLLASKFLDVIENWVPPPMPSDSNDFGDQEWLFVTKQRSRDKRCDLDSVGVTTSHANTTTWPRVCYLPEADVYALPFTVPF